MRRGLSEGEKQGGAHSALTHSHSRPNCLNAYVGAPACLTLGAAS
jgi:hypothetical protein